MQDNTQESLTQLDIEKSADVVFALQAFEHAKQKLQPVQEEYFAKQEALAQAVLSSGSDMALVNVGGVAKLVMVDDIMFVKVRPISVT